VPFGYRTELNVDANLELTTGPWCYRLLVQLRTLQRGSNLFLNSVVQLMLPWVKLTKVSVLLFKSVSELQKAKRRKTKEAKSVYDTKRVVCILGDNLKASKEKSVFNWFCFHLLRTVLFHILWGWGGKRAYLLLLLSLGTSLVICFQLVLFHLLRTVVVHVTFNIFFSYNEGLHFLFCCLLIYNYRVYMLHIFTLLVSLMSVHCQTDRKR